MLKRNDLAKQFELVTQQEIKNYNDSLNGVLDSIRNLKKEIKDVSEKSLEHYGAIHSVQTNLSIEIENIKDFLKSLSAKLDSTFNDQNVCNKINTVEIQDLKNAFHRKISVDVDYLSKNKALYERIQSLEYLIDQNDKNAKQSIDEVSRRFRQDIARTKQEIMDAPTEASLVRKDLEEKMATHTVDVEGIMRELRLYKHDNMVTQKKIENIYTLIGRLNTPQGDK